MMLRLGASPGIWIIVFVLAAALMVGAVTVLLDDRKRRLRARFIELAPRPDGPEGPARATAEFGRLGAWIADSPLVGAGEQAKMSAKLAAAGFASKDALKLFVAAKCAVLLGMLVAGFLISGWLAGDSTLFAVAITVGFGWIGWRLPDMAVGRVAKQRRRAIKNGMPDVLDLMVICVEAGLGLEQALERVARDLRAANPIIAYELETTVAEMRVLPQTRMALENLSRRAGVAMVQSVMTTLIQALRYGTPLAQSLRILASDMRTHRLLEIEERAAKLPVMLTLPLIFFILPSLFLVVGGPAALQVSDLMHGAGR